MYGSFVKIKVKWMLQKQKRKQQLTYERMEKAKE
jgi:hypothetical protein